MCTDRQTEETAEVTIIIVSGLEKSHKSKVFKKDLYFFKKDSNNSYFLSERTYIIVGGFPKGLK